MKNEEQHIWYFPSKGLKALFDEEIRGQLSDGAWENSTPFNHWNFWCGLATKVGPKWDFKFNNEVDYEDMYPKKKTGYNLLTLVDPDVIDLSDRMRAYYVDAELGLGLRDNAVFLIGGGLEKIRNLATSLKSEYWKDKVAKIEMIAPERVEAFYEAYEAYTRRHLIQDLKLIKKQMKVVIELASNN